MPEIQVAAAGAVGLLSAAGFAAANALQHRSAGKVPEAVGGALRLLACLARQRVWLAATAVSFGAMVLHAVALKLGSLAFVQPLMLFGVVLAVLLRAALDHALPTTAEVAAVGITVTGLGLFVVATNPAPALGEPETGAVLAFAALGCAVGALVLWVSGHDWLRRHHRAALLGAGAGVMFGVTAGLLKAVGGAVSEPARLLLLVGGLVVGGLLGVAMNQRAYQIAPLACSMPLVNVVDVLVAVLFGAVVFGESPAHAPGFLLLQALGLLVTTVGLRRIFSLEPAEQTAGQVACKEAVS